MGSSSRSGGLASRMLGLVFVGCWYDARPASDGLKMPGGFECKSRWIWRQFRKWEILVALTWLFQPRKRTNFLFPLITQREQLRNIIAVTVKVSLFETRPHTRNRFDVGVTQVVSETVGQVIERTNVDDRSERWHTQMKPKGPLPMTDVSKPGDMFPTKWSRDRVTEWGTRREMPITQRHLRVHGRNYRKEEATETIKVNCIVVVGKNYRSRICLQSIITTAKTYEI